jgi:hypothetical protein
LLFAALALLPDYRRQLRVDSRSALSVSVLRKCIRSAGISGYIAAGFFIGAIVCLGVDAVIGVSAVAPLLNLLE